MKITLISVYESNVALGMRIISALLKKAGYSTRMIFLPRETEGLRHEGFRFPYAASALAQVSDLVAGSDLIGISLASNYFDNAVQITRHLRRNINVPIVWGGIHPTVRPEECLEHADIVCVGEGEEAILDLVRQLEAGKGYAGISNLWYKENGVIVRTPIRPLVYELDRFPHPDYDLSEEYALYQGKVQRMTDELMYYYLRWPYTSDSEPTYVAMMSRGCVCSCTYCCNNAFLELYGKKWRVRQRSVADFIGELRAITVRFPGIKWIRIDDDLFVENVETVRKFADAYKQSGINVPLFVTGFHSSMVHEEVVRLLVKAGMQQARIGIQTASTEILHKVYKRPGSLERVKRTIQIFHKYADRLKLPVYDLIIDNPWESEEDQLQTLRLLLDIPKPYAVTLFSLTFYPGTELYERARAEGFLRDEQREVYNKWYLEEKRTYINGLFRLFRFGYAPRWLMAWLLTERMRRLRWTWLPYLINELIFGLRLASAGWRALRRGDLRAFGRAVRARIRRWRLVPKWA